MELKNKALKGVKFDLSEIPVIPSLTPADSEPESKPPTSQDVSPPEPMDFSSSTIPTPSTAQAGESQSERVKKTLIRRRDAFLRNAKAAQQANDRQTAAELIEMVKMFSQAIEAAKSAELTEADLAEVPKTPPPYRV